MFEWLNNYLMRKHAFKSSLCENPCFLGHKYEGVYNTVIGEFADFEVGRIKRLIDLQNLLEAGRSRTKTYICHICTRCGNKINKE